MISQRGAASWKNKGSCIQCARPGYLGQGTGPGEDDSQYGTRGLLSHCRHIGGKDDESLSTREKRTNQTPAVACDKEWMQGIEQDNSEVEWRNGRVGNH